MGDNLKKYTGDYTLYDFETTGLSTEDDDLIQVAAVKVRNGVIVDEFVTYVEPRVKMNPKASETTGITDDMLHGKGYPTSSEALDSLLKFAGEDTLVGHNINNFDSNFIRREKGEIPNPMIDTLEVARAVKPELKSKSIEALTKHYGIEYEGAHDALNDTKMNSKIFGKLGEDMQKRVDNGTLKVCPQCGSVMSKIKSGNGYIYRCPYHPDQKVKGDTKQQKKTSTGKNSSTPMKATRNTPKTTPKISTGKNSSTPMKATRGTSQTPKKSTGNNSSTPMKVTRGTPKTTPKTSTSTSTAPVKKTPATRSGSSRITTTTPVVPKTTVSGSSKGIKINIPGRRKTVNMADRNKNNDVQNSRTYISNMFRNLQDYATEIFGDSSTEQDLKYYESMTGGEGKEPRAIKSKIDAKTHIEQTRKSEGNRASMQVRNGEITLEEAQAIVDKANANAERSLAIIEGLKEDSVSGRSSSTEEAKKTVVDGIKKIEESYTKKKKITMADIEKAKGEAMDNSKRLDNLNQSLVQEGVKTQQEVDRLKARRSMQDQQTQKSMTAISKTLSEPKFSAEKATAKKGKTVKGSYRGKTKTGAAKGKINKKKKTAPQAYLNEGGNGVIQSEYDIDSIIANLIYDQDAYDENGQAMGYDQIKNKRVKANKEKLAGLTVDKVRNAIRAQAAKAEVYTDEEGAEYPSWWVNDNNMQGAIKQIMSGIAAREGADNLTFNDPQLNKTVKEYQKPKALSTPTGSVQKVKGHGSARDKGSASFKAAAARSKRKQAAIDSNQHIVENFSKSGKDVSRLVHEDQSAASYQKRIIEGLAARGLTGRFVGSKLEMWPSTSDYEDAAANQKVSSVQFMEMDPEYQTIAFPGGGMQYTNEGSVFRDYKNGMSLITANENQYKKFMEMFITNKSGTSKLVEAALQGGAENQEYVSEIGKIPIKKAVEGESSNLTKAQIDENKKDMYGAKTPEQAYIQRGKFNLSDYFKQVARQNKDFLSAVYEEQGRGEFNPEDVVPGNDVYEAMAKSFVYRAYGQDEEIVSKLKNEDSLLGALYREEDGASEAGGKKFDTTFYRFRAGMDEIIDADLVPLMDSIKEEAALKGSFSTNSTSEMHPLNMQRDFSNRGPTQTDKFMRRGPQGSYGRESVFESQEGVDNGVDSSRPERLMYTGAMMNDRMLLEAIDMVNAANPGMISEEEKMFMSTHEGGMVASPELQGDIAAYRYSQDFSHNEDIDERQLLDLGIDPEQLAKLAIGEQLSLGDMELDREASFGKGKYGVGDILKSITKGRNGYTMNADRWEVPYTGKKGLVGGVGGRQSMRFMSDTVDENGNVTYTAAEKFEALRKAASTITGADYSNLDFLVEEKTDTTKSSGFGYQGRIENMINESGLSPEEILPILQQNMIAGDSMFINENGKIDSTAKTDVTDNGKVKYEDKNGVMRDMFDYDENGKASEAQMALTYIEDIPALVRNLEADIADLKVLAKNETDLTEKEKLNAKLAKKQNLYEGLTTEDENGNRVAKMGEIEKIGRALLGDEGYEANRGKNTVNAPFDAYVNQFEETPYFEPTGSGNAELVHAKGGPRAGFRDRDANTREINDSLVSADDELREDIEMFRESEIEQTNLQSQESLEAKQHIAKIKELQTANGYTSDYEPITGYKGGTKHQEGENPADETGRLGASTVLITTDGHGNVLFDGVPIGNFTPGLDNDATTPEESRAGYEASFMGKLHKYMKENGKTSMVLEDQSKKRMMMYDTHPEGIMTPEGMYYQSETGNIISEAITSIVNGQLPGAEADEKAQEKAAAALDKAAGKYEHLATSKDSGLVKKATQTETPNSRWAENVGINTEQWKRMREVDPNLKANTSFMNSETWKAMERSEEGSTVEEINKATKKQLYRLASASGVTDEERLRYEDAINTSFSEGSSRQLQEEILNKTVEAKKKLGSDMVLPSQVNRNPYTSGKDKRYTDVAFNEQLEGSTIMASPAINAIINGDFDGDHVSQRTLGSGFIGDTYEEWLKQEEGVKKIINDQNQVAEVMEDYYYKDIDSEYGEGTKKKEEIPEEEQTPKGNRTDKTMSYVEDLADRKANLMASVSSRFDKKYVGLNSSASTNARNFMSDFGFDEMSDPGSEMAAAASVIRSFFEGTEQAPISAKKKFQQIQRGEEFTPDDLEVLQNYIRSGDFATAADAMDTMGIDYERQYQAQKAAWMAANSGNYENGMEGSLEAWNSIFGENASISDTVKKSFDMLIKYMSKLNGDLNLTSKYERLGVGGDGRKSDLVMQTKKRKKAKDKFGNKIKLNLPKNKGAKTTDNGLAASAQEAAGAIDQVTASTAELSSTEEARNAKSKNGDKNSGDGGDGGDGGGDEPPGDNPPGGGGGSNPPGGDKFYEALLTRDSENYGKDGNHERDFFDQSGRRIIPNTTVETGKNVEAPDSKVSVTKMDDIFANINRANEEASMTPREKERKRVETEQNTATGTYFHKLAEMMLKTGTTTIDDAINSNQIIEGKSVGEIIKQAEAEMQKVFGLHSESKIKQARIDAEAGVKSIQGTELVGPDAMQELTLGGRFKNSKGGYNYVSGQADMIGIKADGSGITVGDWKNSKQNDDATNAKRIMQASMYGPMLKEAVNQRREYLEQLINGGGSEEEINKAVQQYQSLEKLANAANNGNNEALIVRVQNGVVEHLRAQLVDEEEVMKYMNAATEYTSLNNELNKLQSEGGEGSGDKIKEIKAKMEKIVNSGIFKNPEEIFEFAGLMKDAQGQLVNSFGQSAFINGQYNPETGGIEDVAEGKAVVGSNGKRQPSNKKYVNEYTSAYKRSQRIEEDITRTQGRIENSSGSTKRSEEARLQTLQKSLAIEKQRMGYYDKENRILNGIKLSEAEAADLNMKMAAADAQHELKLNAINTKLKTEAGLLDKIFNGFKQQFSNFLGMNLTYQLVGKIRQMFTDILQTVEEIDSSIVSLQIACGGTRDEVKAMMGDFNEIAISTGRTTSEVAEASNDWLRAGYSTEDVGELTNASMSLSTLGELEASEATEHLISSLKGWKLEAKDVASVVDKLTTLDMAYATSAGDLAEAMSRANNIARSAGSSMDNYMAYITVSADVTQKAAESVGEAWKTLKCMRSINLF